jgi:hypothetical protein
MAPLRRIGGGYENVRRNRHLEQQINDAEAAIVRRIFELATG